MSSRGKELASQPGGLEEGPIMLLLTRKVGERIRIGEDVVLLVVAVNGTQVRLGIEAPSSIPIWRGELLGPGRPEDGKGGKDPD